MITIYSYIFNKKPKDNDVDFLNYIMARLERNGFYVDYLNYQTRDSKPVVLIVAIDAENIAWVGTHAINKYTRIELGCIDEKGRCIHQII